MDSTSPTSYLNTRTPDQASGSEESSTERSAGPIALSPGSPFSSSIVPLQAVPRAIIYVERLPPKTAHVLSTPSIPCMHGLLSSSSSINPPILDARASMERANLQLKDACRQSDSVLAMQTSKLFVDAAELFRKDIFSRDARKQSFLCMFLSQRCTDVSDLINHGISISDYSETCYDDIELFLQRPISRTPMPQDTYQCFVKNDEDISKLNDGVVDMLYKGKLQQALNYIKLVGERHYQKNSYIFYYCQQQHAYLTLAVAALTNDLRLFESAKSQLYQASYQINDVDTDRAIRLLHEARRVDVAAKIVAKGHRLHNIHTFLNSNTAPEPIGPIMAAFSNVYTIGCTPIPEQIEAEGLVACHNPRLLDLSPFDLPPQASPAEEVKIEFGPVRVVRMNRKEYARYCAKNPELAVGNATLLMRESTASKDDIDTPQ